MAGNLLALCAALGMGGSRSQPSQARDALCRKPVKDSEAPNYSGPSTPLLPLLRLFPVSQNLLERAPLFGALKRGC